METERQDHVISSRMVSYDYGMKVYESSLHTILVRLIDTAKPTRDPGQVPSSTVPYGPSLPTLRNPWDGE